MQHPSEITSFTPGLAEGHREQAARGKESWSNAVMMTMPRGKISQGKPWLCPLVVLSQIQADSKDDKTWTHFYCTPLKLMLKVSVTFQPSDSLTLN